MSASCIKHPGAQKVPRPRTLAARSDVFAAAKNPSLVLEPVSSPELISPVSEDIAMLVERGMQVTSVEVVSDAYAIAANYLRRSGVLPDTVQPNDQLVGIIVQLFQRGEANKLKLANKAIAMFEAAA
jgi:hypothetical protein